ncbi:hypothetical protein [Sulfurovum sp.]|uniref:hypothetical protein n=1 Tax=Sulfurovum sp. TaxID=1969726 RepID=UPI00286814A6|nr:hypothetical protein [Sulfurovum sp.]
MIKAIVRVALLASMLPLLLNANYILRNDLLKIEAEQRINEMGEELQSKTGVTAYLIATNEHFVERYNLLEYTKQYEANMSKPYVLFIFAPYAAITTKSEARGRVGIIPSSDSVKSLYNYDDVRDAGIDIVAIKDSNTEEDKFNIGILQAYSELADGIASSKGLKLEKTIPDEMGVMVTILRVLVYTGTLVLLWIFVFRSLWMRIKNGK